MVFEIPPTSAAATPRPLWLGIGGVMLALLVACLVGILSRIGNFPAFWPANAVLLGLLLRHAHLARRPVTWACMWLVYVLADLVTGASLFVALTLNTANIVGVLCGWLFLYRQGIQKQGFQRQRAVLVMFCGCLLYAVSSALVGTWPSHVAFGTPLWRVLLMWIATEFCNCVLVLPVILSAPRGWVWQWKSPVNFHSWHYVLPLGALLLTEVLSWVFHGPGSVAFVIPSLVWCGLAYGVFATAVINFVFGIAKLLAVSLGALVVYSPDNVMDVASFRAGLSLLTLAPLAVASIQVLHNQTLQRLKQAVNHDFLTGALARRAFMDRGQKLLARLQQESRSVGGCGLTLVTPNQALLSLRDLLAAGFLAAVVPLVLRAVLVAGAALAAGAPSAAGVAFLAAVLVPAGFLTAAGLVLASALGVEAFWAARTGALAWLTACCIRSLAVLTAALVKSLAMLAACAMAGSWAGSCSAWEAMA